MKQAVVVGILIVCRLVVNLEETVEGDYLSCSLELVVENTVWSNDIDIDDSLFYLERKFNKYNYYVNTEITQIIAEYRNAQEVNVNESNNPPTSPEHPIIN